MGYIEGQWSNPPQAKAKAKDEVSARGEKGKYVRVADQLRNRPGRWRLVKLVGSDRRNPGAFAHQLKQGRVTGFARGEFEAVSRKLDDGTGRVGVWARYPG